MTGCEIAWLIILIGIAVIAIKLFMKLMKFWTEKLLGIR